MNFSSNTPSSSKNEIRECLNFKVSSLKIRYMGLPLFIGAGKRKKKKGSPQRSPRKTPKQTTRMEI